MNRQRSGIALLAIAALVVVFLPKALAPGPAGSATRAPLPSPPSVGSCLAGVANEVVPCSEPHEQEVIAAWEAGDPTRPVGPQYDKCRADDYLGPAMEPIDPIWDSPYLSATVRIVTAPKSERIGKLGWKVCIVRPSFGGDYVGSVAAPISVTERPGAFGSCIRSASTDLQFAQQDISCTDPHQLEVLATVNTFQPDDPSVDLTAEFPLMPSPEVLQTQCQTIAGTLLGVPDPSYGGQLTIEARFWADPTLYTPGWVDETGNWVETGTAYAGTSYTATCLARATDLSWLNDSVIGNGSAPLPYE